MKDIFGIIFVFGAAIVVLFIVASDLFWKKDNVKPYAKWLVVAILSIWQVGCWRALSSFDSAFGNSTDLAWYEIIFVALVIMWVFFQIKKYLAAKKNTTING